MTGDYTIIQMERQKQLTRLIQAKLAKASRKANKTAKPGEATKKDAAA
jgi:hypothetical protein